MRPTSCALFQAAVAPLRAGLISEVLSQPFTTSDLPDQIARVCLAQVICALTPRNGRLYVSGLGAVRDLLGSMIASECGSHARATASEARDSLVLTAVPFALRALDVIKICITQKHSNTSAMVAGRPLVGLMRSMSVPGSLLYTSASLPTFPL